MRTTICRNARQPSSIQSQHCLHFITFTCDPPMKLLDSVAARDTFEQELEPVRRQYGCFVTGYVVMPEHVHLLLSAPERGGKLSLIIQMLKQIPIAKVEGPISRDSGRFVITIFPCGARRSRVALDARRRERLGVVPTALKAHPPAHNAGRVGQPQFGN
ncbi:MAG TPA: hypothetical protein VMG82_09530 [Candidatus Sulfotelmatobacter sp.]|nr:hypothetical protein [Candidatus Sulfotelmatobacter sp.]